MPLVGNPHIQVGRKCGAASTPQDEFLALRRVPARGGYVFDVAFASTPYPLLLWQSLETALKYCNYLFTTVFVFEAVLKLVAFGLRRFFKDR